MSDHPTTPPPAGAIPSAADASRRGTHAMSPERQRLLRRLTPALLVVGAFLLVAFEATITLLLGVILLLAAVVCGVIMIAEPGFLAADGDPFTTPPDDPGA